MDKQVKEMVELINQTRVSINEGKIDIIPVNQDIIKASGSIIPRVGRKKKSFLLSEGNYKIQELFIPSVKILKQAITGEPISERMLDASKYIIDQVKGKARAAVDVTHDVSPYNWVIRELTESTYSQENEEGNGLLLPENTSEGE